ncbi:hypothetical protein KPH14_003547 [Odynerus spinipes]|uniref:Uncharacterized protein n=1 Tax=Odynerus spinipes TaxID=1348599 RepID=A0AAD9RCX8_9HYME|nr:hypothetical protein KPH14_003547 [Odynerus spinipes]
MNARIIASSRFRASAIVVVLLFFVFSLVLADSCPSFCDCDIWYELKRARCVGRHLYSIHTDASSNVQALDLSDNSISSLANAEIADAGLTNLKYLNLSKNSISEIALEAFSRLTELTVLDLSKNHLYHLLPDIFLETTNLRVLKLSKNNFNVHVPKLQCPWLTELDVHSCQISHIPADTFAGLTHLRSLDLTNNLMIQLDNVVLRPLQFLRKVSLEGNPWSCNKMMYDLEASLRFRRVEHDAACNKTSPGSKKFEKMILRPPQDPRGRSHSLSTDREHTKSWGSVKCDNEYKNASTLSPDVESDDSVVRRNLQSMSPYWFLAMGFLLGCATSMVVCYMCLSNRSSCRRHHDYRDTFDGDPQRVFLLQNQWHVAEPTLDSSQTISCPGTPPPPYRDVMLRPGLYRAAPANSNLNNNAAGYGT